MNLASFCLKNKLMNIHAVFVINLLKTLSKSSKLEY